MTKRVPLPVQDRLARPHSLRPGFSFSLECAPVWDGNWTWDCLIAWIWEGRKGDRMLVAVNFAGNQTQCYVRLPWPDLASRGVRLTDLTGTASHDRDGIDLVPRPLPRHAAMELSRLRREDAVTEGWHAGILSPPCGLP
jgi:hypothetical protein